MILWLLAILLSANCALAQEFSHGSEVIDAQLWTNPRDGVVTYEFWLLCRPRDDCAQRVHHFRDTSFYMMQLWGYAKSISGSEHPSMRIFRDERGKHFVRADGFMFRAIPNASSHGDSVLVKWDYAPPIYEVAR